MTVVSDSYELLRLKRTLESTTSTTFQEHHDDRTSVLEQLSEIQMQRTKSEKCNNRMLLERRKSSQQTMMTNEDQRIKDVLNKKNKDEGLNTKEDVLKPRSLKEKGVPVLSVVASESESGRRDERSLFS